MPARYRLLFLALSSLPMTACAAGAPLAGALPGAFWATPGVSYRAQGARRAAIRIQDSSAILFFGAQGATLKGFRRVPAPPGVHTAPGFQIGPGARLRIQFLTQGPAPNTVVIFDDTGRASQIQGRVEVDHGDLVMSNPAGLRMGGHSALIAPQGFSFYPALGVWAPRLLRLQAVAGRVPRTSTPETTVSRTPSSPRMPADAMPTGQLRHGTRNPRMKPALARG